ncbi:Adenosine deaminase related growth factor [Operophtera brumata]|uniref:Adenosine deaminase n=1 Tax=Operophtera brumata TaxID=104452 RepID=A0A0L7K4B9_OPEBR|nr:Adenosine deaminase related growth factor [Operophtera brumata]
MRLLIVLSIIFAHGACDIADYYAKRAKLAEAENLLTVGGNYPLDHKETIVNRCLMQHKYRELDYAFDNPQYFNCSHHFFVYKNKMRESKVYKIIKNMPKGAALHVHDMALLGPDYVMNLTYMDNLYFCFKPDPVLSGNHLFLQFANQLPNKTCDTWQLISDARRDAKNVTEFDFNLRKHFTLVVDDPDTAYPAITDTWDAFMNYFTTIIPLVTYRPVWEQYFYDALKKYREDNLMYIEVRSVLPNLYELDGSTYDQIVTAKSYKKVLSRFIKDYPDFEGAKIIFAPSRYVGNAELDAYIETARSLKNQVPEIFAGFDLVGQEDKGKPLIDFVPKLLQANDLNFFFHAGETDWYGTQTDGNLYDAILLGTKRIGHAYALTKHPLLMKEVVEKDIGLEINLISNSVLSLVKDLRNHPLNTYVANGMPVVLSSDDPGAWEAEPASDDFYVAFVGASSRLSDLSLLKALGENSLKYSALEPTRKAAALRKLNFQWKRFIDNFDCSKY